VLWFSRQRLGIDAVLDRHNSFLPDPLKFLHHASFFIVGAGLYRVRHSLLPRLARVGPVYLALTFPVFAGRAYLLGRDWTTPLTGPAALALVVLGALLGWLIVLGFVGVFLRLFRQAHPAISYLADSSYWIYLVHMPVIGLLQVDLYRIPGHALWKFPIVWAVTLALGFASYQTLVRHTAIGVWLHGQRQRPLRIRLESVAKPATILRTCTPSSNADDVLDRDHENTASPGPIPSIRPVPGPARSSGPGRRKNA
jgi:peptidoglycan/LPS O-acetylase OafA/YrhL